MGHATPPRDTVWCRWSIFVVTVILFVLIPKGFFPSEDTGQIFAITEASQDISFDAMRQHQLAAMEIVRADPNVECFMSAIGAGGPSATLNQGRMFMHLKPRSERKLSADQIIQELRAETGAGAGHQRVHAESAADPRRRQPHQGAVSVQPAGHRHEGTVPLGADLDGEDGPSCPACRT